MITYMRTLLLCIIPVLVMGQDSASTTWVTATRVKSATAATVTDAQRAAYWRALYEVTVAEADPNAQKKPTTLAIAAAQAKAEAAHVRLVAAVVDINRSCGVTELQMYFDGAGEPACPQK